MLKIKLDGIQLRLLDFCAKNIARFGRKNVE